LESLNKIRYIAVREKNERLIARRSLGRPNFKKRTGLVITTAKAMMVKMIDTAGNDCSHGTRTSNRKERDKYSVK